MVSHELREDIRNDLRGLFVGERTIGDSFLAPLVFVGVNAFSSLGPASIAALLVGGAVAGWRIRKGQEPMYAFGGIVAIGFAAVLALRSGRAESYFLPGIVGAGVGAAAGLVSVVAKRPLAAWSSQFYRRWPQEWYWRDDVRPAYTAVTWLWIVFFALRAGLQGILFLQERPELLAFAKVITSWPLIIPLLIASYVLGNTKLHRLGGPNVEEFEAGAEPPFAGSQRGF
ncbi:MAG: DUF3159 domain-containing protein [Acidimicrobiia bacterium]|nr:DUF3159 domain-containing protein [Acidimicrobiia bacterium]